MIQAALARLLDGCDLSGEQARGVMNTIMSGEATPAQIGGFLVALRLKGETPDEIAGCAEAMREHVLRVAPRRADLVDTAGTGGDGANTWNISTAAALVAAAAGAGVAKHGNRAASSATGAADVLEALGFELVLPAEQLERSIDELGFGFLFAPAHHPAMKHAGPVRRELAARTVFNVLGPLTNPAGARAQLVGVYAPEIARTIAEALVRLDARRAYVVHGAGGIDELSPAGPNLVCEVDRGSIREYQLDPQDLGVDRATRGAPRRRPADERPRAPERPRGRAERGRPPRCGAPERRRRDRRRGPGSRPARGPRARARRDRLGRRREPPRRADRLLPSGGLPSARPRAERRSRTPRAGCRVRFRGGRGPRRGGTGQRRSKGKACGSLTRFGNPGSGRSPSSSAGRPRPATLRPDGDVVEVARSYERAGARAISVLVDERFAGSWDDLRAARTATSLTLLAKWFFSTSDNLRTAAEAGADAALLILRDLDDVTCAALMREATRIGLDRLVEAHDAGEGARGSALGAA